MEKLYTVLSSGDLYGVYRVKGDKVSLTDEQAAEIVAPRGRQVALVQPAAPSVSPLATAKLLKTAVDVDVKNG